MTYITGVPYARYYTLKISLDVKTFGAIRNLDVVQ